MTHARGAEWNGPSATVSPRARRVPGQAAGCGSGPRSWHERTRSFRHAEASGRAGEWNRRRRWVRVHDGPPGRGRDRAPRVWCGGQSYGVGTMARPPESWRRHGGSGSAEEDAQSVAEIFVAQVTTPP